MCGIVQKCVATEKDVAQTARMSKTPKPRVVFELENAEHKKAKELATADSRKTVSAWAKARISELLKAK